MVQGEERAKIDTHPTGSERHVKTILLVEDDANIGEVLLQAISQETTYIAILVTNGFEALEMVKGIKPDLFILDYHLPRMNGLELYDQLHDIAGLEEIPTIMVSARLPQQDLEKRNILGMNKPIDLDDFLTSIDLFLA